jgi:hypothetical protein
MKISLHIWLTKVCEFDAYVDTILKNDNLHVSGCRSIEFYSQNIWYAAWVTLSIATSLSQPTQSFHETFHPCSTSQSMLCT